jgi:hypothetical protein
MVAFLLDEDTHGGLMDAFRRRTRLGVLPAVDVLRVGGADAPAFSTLDPELLIWCELNDRVLVSEDKNTLPGHLNDHLTAGRHSPGVLLIRPGVSMAEVIDELVFLSEAGNPDDFRDQIAYIPL